MTTALLSHRYDPSLNQAAPPSRQNCQPRRSEAEPLWIVDRGFVPAEEVVGRHAANGRERDVKDVQNRRVHTRPDFWSPTVIADLDTLLTALYVELTDRIIPARGFTRRGPGGRK
jgi:hypothetical protein